MIKAPAVTKEDVFAYIDSEIAPELGGAVRIFLLTVSSVLSVSFVSVVVFALSQTEVRAVFDFAVAWIMRLSSEQALNASNDGFANFALACLFLGFIAACLIVLFIKVVRKLCALFMSPFVSEHKEKSPEEIKACQDLLQLLTIVEEMEAFIDGREAVFAIAKGKHSHTIKVTVTDDDITQETRSFYLGSAWSAEDFVRGECLDFSRIRPIWTRSIPFLQEEA